VFEMPNERIIAKMKLVKQNQKRMQSKAEHRRSKVIAKLEEQLAMAEVNRSGFVGDHQLN
jgi:hypothetical protein